MKNYSIAIVGATGLVGTTLLSLLAERNFPVNQLFPLASQQSSGKHITFRGEQYRIQDLSSFDFTRTRIAFFCVGNDLAAEYAPKAAAAGNVVIDKSFYYRNHEDVPLLVPEVNLDALAGFRKRNIIANPNCNTIPIAVGLKPIYDAVGIERINVATYQSVSGTGKEAVAELTEQSRQLLDHQHIQPRVYSQQIAFNILPHIDEFQDNGYTREEMKIVWEMQKIYDDRTLAINPTAVRVPVVCGHSASVHIETREKISTDQALKILASAPGVRLVTGKFPYATPVVDATGNDHVHIGRVREDISHTRGLNLWIVSDNLRKGAATNAVQIAEHLIEHYSPL
ncbi:Aspartate-semialdehyde dehydrogenase 2 [Aquicella siphonis]|uniref:Aspartate-semialdehyde dehydrogenase n=1 Tax=Aquicella siphonis TaxID=254247 RepID=A0A5E4PG84_9COXI|nr:aspartate-semialdehyde dehydrogenase [Aquicella siphonis]VVC75864.1 Aspartate-semialdehyde dehydrogenase 2 [Aquicella siphonis]